MVIGMDFHNTITKDEKTFKRLAMAYANAGIPVYIISALKTPTNPDIKKAVLKCKVPNQGIELVYFKDYGEIAELKLEVCRRLHVTFMYDDMESVCKLLAKNGITTAQVR